MEKITASGPGFAPVPIRLLRDKRITDPTTIAVYCALASFIDYGTGRCFPSLRTIGARARCSDDTARRHVEILAALGYVEKRSGRAAGRSNTYHLADAWGRQDDDAPAPQGYRMDSAGGTAPAPDKRDSGIETQEKEGEAPAPSREAAPRHERAPLPASRPEDQVLEELADVPGLVHDRRFREGCRRLLAEGRTPGEIAQAVKAAAGDAHERGGLSFIVDRFARWQRKARELEQWRAAPTVEERLEKERRDEEERARIRAEQDSPEGRELVAAAVTRLPWNVARGA